LSIWDFVIVIVLLFGAYRGFQKGLLMTVVSLFALVVGVIGAVIWTPTLVQYVSVNYEISTPTFSVLAFLIIFVAIVIVLNVVGKLLKLVIDLTPIGALDGVIGALIGTFKWVVGISIIIWVLDKAQIELPTTGESELITGIRQVAPFVLQQFTQWLPYLKEVINDLVEIIEQYRP